MFAQAFTQYFVYLTDYGFELSATREISIHRDEIQKIAEIFNSVMTIKIILLFLSVIILSLIVFSFQKFRKDWPLYFFAFGMVTGQVFFPIWFFQGFERMKVITQLNILAKAIFAISIFIFIKNSTDYLFVPLINSLGFIAASILALWIIFKKFKIKLFLPEVPSIFRYFKASTPYFLSRVSVVSYTSSNAFFLGLATTNQMVGYYSAAERLYLAIRSLYYPLNLTLYPYMSKTQSVGFYKKIFKMTVLVNIILCILTFIFAEKIIFLIFGNHFAPSVAVFKVFLIVILFVVPSVLLGYPFLAAMGYPNYANLSVIIASSIHILALIILAFLSQLNIFTITFMVLITEFIVLCIRAYGVKKYGLWRLS